MVEFRIRFPPASSGYNGSVVSRSTTPVSALIFSRNTLVSVLAPGLYSISLAAVAPSDPSPLGGRAVARRQVAGARPDSRREPLPSRSCPELSSGRYFADDANPLLRNWLHDSFRDGLSLHSPVVLFGLPGVGKTVLAETLLSRVEGERRYLTAQDFARWFGQACETRSTSWFREFMGRGQALLIDNLELEELHDATVWELIRLLDDYRGRNGAVIVTMKSSPAGKLSALHAPLASRLGGGLTIEVHSPGKEARKAVIQQWLLDWEIALEPDAMRWLVEQGHESIPETRNRLLRGIAGTRRDRERNPLQPISRPELMDAEMSSRASSGAASLPRLVRIVAQRQQVPVSELRGSGRQRHRVRARNLAIWLARHVLSLPYSRIGQYFGQRDASTVRHSCELVNAAMKKDPVLVQTLTSLARQIGVTGALGKVARHV